MPRKAKLGKKKPFNPILQQVAEMRQIMIEEQQRQPLLVRKSHVQDLREEARKHTNDDIELRQSMERLEAAGIRFAFHTTRRTYRLIDNDVDQSRAVKDGFSIWSPRDMYEYVNLPPHMRELLRHFKKMFGESSFEWESLKDDGS